MKKNTNLCVDLKTVMQNDVLLTLKKSYAGVLTRDYEDHFVFEESVHRVCVTRNPKLFDGKCVSMIRKQDGNYRCFLKKMELAREEDRDKFALRVYNELIEAFSMID